MAETQFVRTDTHMDALTDGRSDVNMPPKSLRGHKKYLQNLSRITHPIKTAASLLTNNRKFSQERFVCL